MLYHLIVNSVNMGKLRKPAKFPRYNGIKEKYGTAIDDFLKEYGDRMNYADAQPFLKKKGINISETTYAAGVFHYRIGNSPLKKQTQQNSSTKAE